MNFNLNWRLLSDICRHCMFDVYDELRKNDAKMGLGKMVEIWGVEELGGCFWLFLLGIIKKGRMGYLGTWV